jgi:hypothetical protein
MTDTGDVGGEQYSRPPDERAREAWERSSENWEWLVQHPDVLEPYRGEYVVIWNRQIVAHGKDPKAVRVEIAASPYWREPFLAFRVPAHDELDGVLAL